MLDSVVRWVEDTPPRQLLLRGAVMSALPLVPVPWVPLAGDVAFGALAALGVAVTGWAVQRRRGVDSLPLELSDRMVRTELGGHGWVACRAWLGRGRAVRSPSVRVRFEPDEGASRELLVDLPCAELCGAWTVQVPEQAEPGWYDVRVEVAEGGSVWLAEKRWHRSDIEAGRFAPPLERKGSWRHAYGDFGSVLPPWGA